MFVAFLAARNRFSRRSLTEGSAPTVSLTTYGVRTDSVFLTLETIGQGDVRPGRLILWIDDPERFSNLPKSLQRLKKRGLEVLLCENFGPHTKYFPYLEAYGDLADALVTADDDVLYPRSWLAGLVEAYRENAQIINCYRARTVRLDGNRLALYVDWPLCTTTIPSQLNFVTGVSGVIYPPRFLAHLRSAGRAFLDLCPKADDIWLHVNAVRLGCKIRQISSVAAGFPVVPGTEDAALYRFNMFSGGNDAQIRKTYQPCDIEALLIGD
jgi:hypothetical protein